jgi:hypothetical protein
VKSLHYSGTSTAGILRYGWLIDGELVGVSIYGTGTHSMRSGPFGPENYTHVLDHHRLAISPRAPKGTASAFLGACLRQIKKDRPSTWAVVTYADLCQGHDGTIYRATNAIASGVVGRGNIEFRDQLGRIQVTQSLAGTWPERRQEARRRGWSEVRCQGKVRYVWLVGSGRRKTQLKKQLLWS